MNLLTENLQKIVKEQLTLLAQNITQNITQKLEVKCVNLQEHILEVHNELAVEQGREMEAMKEEEKVVTHQVKGDEVGRTFAEGVHDDETGFKKASTRGIFERGGAGGSGSGGGPGHGHRRCSLASLVGGRGLSINGNSQQFILNKEHTRSFKWEEKLRNEGENLKGFSAGVEGGLIGSFTADGGARFLTGGPEASGFGGWPDVFADEGRLSGRRSSSGPGGCENFNGGSQRRRKAIEKGGSGARGSGGDPGEFSGFTVMVDYGGGNTGSCGCIINGDETNWRCRVLEIAGSGRRGGAGICGGGGGRWRVRKLQEVESFKILHLCLGEKVWQQSVEMVEYGGRLTGLLAAMEKKKIILEDKLEQKKILKGNFAKFLKVSNKRKVGHVLQFFLFVSKNSISAILDEVRPLPQLLTIGPIYPTYVLKPNKTNLHLTKKINPFSVHLTNTLENHFPSYPYIPKQRSGRGSFAGGFDGGRGGKIERNGAGDAGSGGAGTGSGGGPSGARDYVKRPRFTIQLIRSGVGSGNSCSVEPEGGAATRCYRGVTEKSFLEKDENLNDISTELEKDPDVVWSRDFFHRKGHLATKNIRTQIGLAKFRSTPLNKVRHHYGPTIYMHTWKEGSGIPEHASSIQATSYFQCTIEQLQQVIHMVEADYYPP